MVIKVLKGLETHLSCDSVLIGSLVSMFVLSSRGKFSIVGYKTEEIDHLVF